MAARAAIWAAFLNAGQVCTSAERFYVQEDVADAFIEKLATLTENLVVGNGMDERTEVTPMINAVERARVHDQVLDAVRGGAEVVVGGDIPPGYGRGFFYAPTVIRAPASDILMMREETFGPVAPVQTYRTFDEALALANGTDYGLGATLFSFDARRIRQYFEEIQAGNVWVNDPLIDNLAGPFGGVKLSGLGRELGIEGFDEFRETKHVHWDFEGRRKGWWYPYAEVDS
jgi:betaine-aldehyde dehydrogenase